LRDDDAARLPRRLDDRLDVVAGGGQPADRGLLLLADDVRDGRGAARAVVPEHEEPDEQGGDGQCREDGEPGPDVIDQHSRRRRRRLRAVGFGVDP
jgi:hypothetical protein